MAGIWDLILGAGQGVLNLGQQQQAQQWNQQALGDSIGLQSLAYGQAMGAPGSYLSNMLGYGFNPYSPQGQSMFSHPESQGQGGGGGGGFLGLGSSPDGLQRDIFGNVTGGQYSGSGNYGGPYQQQQGGQDPRGQGSGRNAQMMQNARLRPGAGGPMGRHPSGDDFGHLGGMPQFQSLPGLAGDVTQGYWNRANQGASGVDALQQQMMGAYGQGGQDIQGLTNQAAGNVQGGYGALGAEVGAMGNSLNSQLQGGYWDRYSRNMDRIAGLGQAEENRIRDDYSDLGASQEAGLANRGLGASTISGTMATGRQREMNRDLGDLSERLRREMTGYDTQLSGDALSALGAQGNMNIGRNMDIGLQGLGGQTGLWSQGLGMQGNLIGQGLQNQSGLGQWGLGFNAGLSGDALGQQYGMGNDVINMNTAMLGGAANTLGSVNYPYPQGGALDPLMNVFAARAAKPETPGYNPTGDIIGGVTGILGPWGAASIYKGND